MFDMEIWNPSPSIEMSMWKGKNHLQGKVCLPLCLGICGWLVACCTQFGWLGIQPLYPLKSLMRQENQACQLTLNFGVTSHHQYFLNLTRQTFFYFSPLLGIYMLPNFFFLEFPDWTLLYCPYHGPCQSWRSPDRCRLEMRRRQARRSIKIYD